MTPQEARKQIIEQLADTEADEHVIDTFMDAIHGAKLLDSLAEKQKRIRNNCVYNMLEYGIDMRLLEALTGYSILTIDDWYDGSID